MTYEDYLMQVQAFSLREFGWRKGQTYFNVLAIFRGDLAEQVRATPVDPFHNDSALPAFLEKVKARWNIVQVADIQKIRCCCPPQLCPYCDHAHDIGHNPDRTHCLRCGHPMVPR